MNLHQFRFVREAVRQNFNLTEAAKALYTSQPGVSKAIIELEEELGVDIFTRHGKRIRSLTEPGRRILTSVEKILQEVESLKRVGKDYAAQDQGNFTIATTHTQARYALPRVISEFTKRYPKVRLSIQQGNPAQIADMILHDQADLGIATEGISGDKSLVSLPGYQWQHMVITPPDHPLLEKKHLTLEDLATFPLITYDVNFAGRPKIDKAFELRHLQPDIVLEAIDADVIKTYVEVGLGVGIVAGLAYDPERDRNLRGIPAGHLFGTNVTHLAVKQGAYLRSFVYTFIELFSPTLNRKLVEQAMSGDHEAYEL
ncbi:LysR family transcriptional regulator, cys regulon transcriptional activator [Cupriavidus metallidurans]|jgi:LysR family transcriptional regulator, cys regulon transcriptional activator|uniref:DNA-binding protein transcriptional dual regulator, O-acetyl-L-serine-binding protein n=2 Tax=Cupriavidus metallidurans TaxID=119219 RepID=Q1LJI5_CUPMC|nr:CysB family HTH-type transcriptional regulator [Cupriavidus metallidurans]PCH55609.1 MAG: CysB family HTH-type transcriptional regulator [Burkholderiaceae bacterium]ABF09691.1 DNA-binding protein transcriptional dual regulator, O-acetyl-L-serine-binding protein [Cupriavidus metallidurans CH34]AVA36852.1 CysB family HTH-type transcriptional regulator [Cupriavidus metallidurans]KWW34754.1 HTH-type transcriptional regulator cbl [Cupriavidus metallidurans]MDE4919248.1 CysB family HTH-type trans